MIDRFSTVDSLQPEVAELRTEFAQALSAQLGHVRVELESLHCRHLEVLLHCNGASAMLQASPRGFFGLGNSPTPVRLLDLDDEGARWDIPENDVDVVECSRKAATQVERADEYSLSGYSEFEQMELVNDQKDDYISPELAGLGQVSKHNGEHSCDNAVNSKSSENGSKRNSEGNVKVHDVTSMLQNITEVTSASHHQMKERANHTRKQTGLLGSILYHAYFAHFINFIILFNAAMIGVQVEWSAQHVGHDEPAIFEVMSQCCNAVFVFELICRVTVLGCYEFVLGQEKWWHCFDSIVVIMALLDLLATLSKLQNMGGWTIIRSLRMFRLVRTIRAIRTALIFRELRLVVQGILASLVSLFWLIVLLLIIMFIFGTYITQLVVDRKAEDHRSGATGLQPYDEHFGSLLRSLYSLLQVISAGQNWGVVAKPLFEISAMLGMLFIFYIIFVVFAVLNVVTGVFVDSAQKAADEDVDCVVLDQAAKQKSHIEKVFKVFREADINGDGALTPDEFQFHVQNPVVQAYFKFIQLDFETFGAERLFSLLDFDGGGEIDLSEFVTGCSKFRGRAKSLDLAALHHDVRRLDKKLERLITNLAANVKRTETMMRRRSPSMESLPHLGKTISAESHHKRSSPSRVLKV